MYEMSRLFQEASESAFIIALLNVNSEQINDPQCLFSIFSLPQSTQSIKCHVPDFVLCTSELPSFVKLYFVFYFSVG